MLNRKKVLMFLFFPFCFAVFFASLQVTRLAMFKQGTSPLARLPSLQSLGEPSALALERGKKSLEEGDPSFEISESLLIDSIITIVQNYYVDDSRVDNKVLMESTLRSLVEATPFRLQCGVDKVCQLRSQQESLTVKLSGRYSYDEMMRDSVRVAQFLERNRWKVNSKKPQESGAFQFLTAMLSSLDPHSNLLTPDEYRDLRQGTEGSFGGLGVVVGMQDDVLTVIKPLPKSPAARAGVNRLDRIMQIDGKNTFGTTLDDLVQYMRGEPGTHVNLFLLREGDLAPRALSLTREIIQVDSVESKIIATDLGKIVHIFIDSFSSRTAIELRDALLKAQRDEENIVGIILDMRSNPGGLLDQAVKVADLFLEEGKIVSTQGRMREHENAKPNSYPFDYPLVVLSNSDTASASEIVAGALRDHGRAIVIGEPSFGKGSVQTVFELPGEQALKLTIARYYTPKGISIQNTGIMPDIWLQPVLKNKENWNLLGEFRYKSERYLDHSLDQGKQKVQTPYEDNKAYYLVDEEGNQAKGKGKDIPLEFAQNYLRELAKKEGVPFPTDRLRSSYWKASTYAFVKSSLKKLDDATQEWLAQKNGISWADSTKKQNPDLAKLELAVDLPDRLVALQGQPVLIPWRLKNKSDAVIPRLSLFTIGNRGNIPTAEVLIGSLSPGQETTGVIRFELRSTPDESPILLRVGLAKGGWPLPLEKAIQVEVKEGEVPKFFVQMKLSQEIGGKVNGVLEAGENAQLEIVVKNRSKVLASLAELKVANLAGRQVRLPLGKRNLGTLEPGASRTISVPVQAILELSSNELQFGVSVSCREQSDASKAHFVIHSSPLSKMSKSSNKVGRIPWTEK